jgi:hypothetical protein
VFFTLRYDRLSARRREGLDAAAAALTASRHRSLGALGLFALSPVPSAGSADHLWMATDAGVWFGADAAGSLDN